MANGLKISFGIIVLNGEPYTRYCIKALYTHAHEIIVVEGACPGAKNIATANGHSHDGTLEILRNIKRTEDPENKITIITAEDEGHPDGFWPGEKHQQSQAYAKRATGNYLWQVDIDEFYKDDDIRKVKEMLIAQPDIAAVSFKQIQFWGGFDYVVDGWYLMRGGGEFHRLFKWGEGYHYKTHRPPTVMDNLGRDLRSLKWIRGTSLADRGTFLYHYSYVFEKQVAEKAEYYKEADWAKLKKATYWANDIFLSLKNPFRVFINQDNVSWLERFNGEHPLLIRKMMDDIKQGKFLLELRNTDDIEKLLASRWYNAKREYFRAIEPIDNVLRRYRKPMKRKLRSLWQKIAHPSA